MIKELCGEYSYWSARDAVTKGIYRITCKRILVQNNRSFVFAREIAHRGPPFEIGVDCFVSREDALANAEKQRDDAIRAVELRIESLLRIDFDKDGDSVDEAYRSEATDWTTAAPKTQVMVPAVIPLPTSPNAINYRQLQHWEGRVDTVEDDYFTATIVDRTDTSLPNESAEIDLDELSDADRARVAPGAMFVWSIAYKDTSAGRQTVSEIRFRRMRKCTSQAQNAAERKAKHYQSIFDEK